MSDSPTPPIGSTKGETIALNPATAEPAESSAAKSPATSPATVSPAAPSPPTLSPKAKIGWTILIAATLCVCYFSHLGALGFVGPDEPRYVWIARAMAESGDRVTPRLYGQPWFEKPPLYYWGAAVSLKLFGVSETAARLPCALAALLATLALAWLALRTYGAATARWLLLLLPSTVGMIGFSHAAATDMPFAGTLTIAMVCAPVVLGLTRNDKSPILPRTSWLALVLFGFFLGLAVLAKGPAAIILSGGAIFVWAIFTKRWRHAFRPLHPVAIITFCATALPWYILCARRNPDFFRIFIIEHNFKRFLTPEFQHVQPFWFYAPVVLVAFIPWTATFLWSAACGLRELLREREANDRERETSDAESAMSDAEPKAMTWLLLSWAGFCIIFFSASRSKLPGYILPALPPIALLLARSVAEMRERYRATYRVAHFVDAAILFGIVAFVTVVAREQIGASVRIGDAARVLVSALALANLLAALFADSRTPMAAGFAVAPILGAMLFANAFLASFFREDPSGRTIAREVQRQHIPAGQLSVTGMNRALQYSLSFYLHDEVKNWDPHSPTGGYLLTSKRNCPQVVGAGFFCEEVPFDSVHAGRFLYLVIPIAHATDDVHEHP